MNDIIISLLDHPAFLIAAKIVLTSFFWIAGIFGLFNFKVIVQEMIDVHLPSPRLFAVVTIACQLVGAGLIVFNPAGLGWLGAGALGVFTALTIPIGHPFWKFEEPKKTYEFYIVLEHVTVVGGLMLAAILSVHQ
jgi:uncharacterized membrane protein YphA (DoxX/SURF4 family)